MRYVVSATVISSAVSKLARPELHRATTSWTVRQPIKGTVHGLDGQLGLLGRAMTDLRHTSAIPIRRIVAEYGIEGSPARGTPEANRAMQVEPRF